MPRLWQRWEAPARRGDGAPVAALTSFERLLLLPRWGLAVRFAPLRWRPRRGWNLRPRGIRRLLLYPAELRGHGTRPGCRRQCRCATSSPRASRASASCSRRWPRSRGRWDATTATSDATHGGPAHASSTRTGGWRPAPAGTGPGSGAARTDLRRALPPPPSTPSALQRASRDSESSVSADPSTPAQRTFARVTSGKRPPPATDRASREVRACHVRDGVDDVLDHPLWRRPHERQGQVPLYGSDHRTSGPDSRRTARYSSSCSTASSGSSTHTNIRMTHIIRRAPL